MKNTAGIEINDSPILGCPTCNTTAGKAGCPIHGMTPQEETMEEQKKYFEANLLDGDAIQDGQMLASKEVWKVVKDMLSLQKQSDCREFEKTLLKLKETWKPAFKGESEEEVGFQKGVMAQIGLKNKQIDEVISEQRIALEKMKEEVW